MIGGDLFEIRAVRGYGPDFDSAVEQAREELRTQVRPSFLPPLFSTRASSPAPFPPAPLFARAAPLNSAALAVPS